MRLSIVAVLLSLFLLVGCGTTRKAGTVSPQQSVSDENRNMRDDATARAETQQPRRADNYNRRKPAVAKPAVAKPVTERPGMTFTDRESAHVRLAGIHSIPPQGLDIDLAKLQDEFCYPYKGKLISDYGMRGRSMHTGVDMKAVPGDTIRAAFAGVVRMSKLYSSYGNVVVIRHYDGFETLYSHAVRNLVSVNDVVEAGDPIALAGRTGRATTEHLHFEVRVACEHFDPKKMIDPVAMRLRDDKLYVRMEGGRLLAYNSPQEGESIRAAIAAQAADPAPTPTTVAAVQAAANPPAPQAVYYTVKSGDTMSQIARRYSTTVKKICDLSNVSNPDKLRLGQKLRVK